jgi:hypothetical protein
MSYYAPATHLREAFQPATAALLIVDLQVPPACKGITAGWPAPSVRKCAMCTPHFTRGTTSQIPVTLQAPLVIHVPTPPQALWSGQRQVSDGC